MNRKQALALVAITALALSARFWRLGQESLWSDEFYSLISASQPTLNGVRLHVGAHDPHPPGYFIALHLWIAAFGRSPIALRSLSALFGAAVAPLAYAFARLLAPGRPRMAFAAGVACAVHPMMLWYSQEARAYAALVFWIALSATLAAAYFSCREPNASARARRLSAPAGIGAVVAALVALGFHYYGGFAVLALGVMLAAAAWSERRRSPWLPVVALLLLGTGSAPGALMALTNLRSGQGISWLPSELPASALINIAEAQAIGPLCRMLPGWCVVAVVALAAAWGSIGVAAAARKGAPSLWPRALLASYIGFCFGLPIAISYAYHPIIWWGQRYLVIASPFLVVAFAWAFAAAPRWARDARWIPLAAVAFAQGSYLWNHYAYRQKHVWDVATRAVLAEWRPGDALIVLPLRTAGLLGYYAPEAGFKYSDFSGGLPRKGGVTLVSLRDVRADLNASASFAGAKITSLSTHCADNEIWIYRWPDGVPAP